MSGSRATNVVKASCLVARHRPWSDACRHKPLRQSRRRELNIKTSTSRTFTLHSGCCDDRAHHDIGGPCLGSLATACCGLCLLSGKERLETLEMDLETETRRAKEKVPLYLVMRQCQGVMTSRQVEESIHDFSDKICAFEEVLSPAVTDADGVPLHNKAIKDKEQAVHFGARRYSQQCTNLSFASSPTAASLWSSSTRCLSCNRTFDDVVKTPGLLYLAMCSLVLLCRTSRKCESSCREASGTGRGVSCG